MIDEKQQVDPGLAEGYFQEQGQGMVYGIVHNRL